MELGRTGETPGRHGGEPAMRAIHKTDDLDMWFDKMGGLMVLDDLMEEGGNDKCV